MRKLEIILKILFLVLFVFVYLTNGGFFSILGVGFLIISFLLGLMLLINKDQSYGYPLSFHEVVERRIEGALLIIFSVAVALFYAVNLF